jgi:hypothetical protein
MVILFVYIVTLKKETSMSNFYSSSRVGTFKPFSPTYLPTHLHVYYLCHTHPLTYLSLTIRCNHYN